MSQIRKSYMRRDLTGQKFGKLTPVEWLHGGYWRCICDCGNESIVDTRNLVSGHTQSCGCKIYESKNVVDMSGYEDENIKVLSRCGKINECASWLCLCKHCGRQFVTKGASIRFGSAKSCGCTHSKYEQKIIHILLENGIEFDSQYTVPGLKGIGGRDLRFDFAIFQNGRLVELIEYNGPQHYSRIPGLWGEYYDVTLEHDKRKREYCEENCIKFKIISFKDPCDTLHDILD